MGENAEAPGDRPGVPTTQCRWCLSAIPRNAQRCHECGTWQGNLGPYGPSALVIGSIVTAFAMPVVLGVATFWYQQTSRTQDATRTRLDQSFKEVKAVVDMLGEWQNDYQSLQINCNPDHFNDRDKCLADYTERLVKMDTFVAQVSWAVSASPVGKFAHDKVREFKDEWWNTTRHALDNTLGRQAARQGGASAFISNAATEDGPYNDAVTLCEQKWDDPKCPSLLQCQQYGFEHSECVKELVDDFHEMDRISLAAYCAVVASLNVTRYASMKQLNASEETLADLKAQICHRGCYYGDKAVQPAPPELTALCK